MGFISSFHHQFGIYIFLEPFFKHQTSKSKDILVLGPLLLVTVPESLIIFFNASSRNQLLQGEGQANDMLDLETPCLVGFSTVTSH